MTPIKSSKSTQQAQQLKQVADVLKVIAHPVRLQILQYLGKTEHASVSALIEHTGIEQSLVSHHLTKLKDKGVLMGQRKGQNVYYKIVDKQILNIFDCMEKCDLID